MDNKLLKMMVENLNITIDDEITKLKIHNSNRDNTESKEIVIIVNDWSGNKIGPHRLFIKIAKSITAFKVIRFDYIGRGESTGIYEEANFVTMGYNLLSVIRYFCQNFKTKKVCLIGFCSGGLISFLVGSILQNITKVILLSPIFINEREFEKLVKLYKKKMNEIRLFQKGYSNETIHCSAIFGEKDPGYLDTSEWYKKKCIEFGSHYYSQCIRGANHGFYGLEWENQIIKHINDSII